MRFTGIERLEEFRSVTRALIIAWRDDLRTRLTRRGQPWGDASIRHRLAALASLFEYLCERNAVTHNPVKGVERPKRKAATAKRRRSAIIRRASFSTRPIKRLRIKSKQRL